MCVAHGQSGMEMKTRFVIALIFLVTSGLANAEIYKCTSAEGAVQFSDHPCGQNATIIKPKTTKVPDNHAAERSEKTRRLLDAYQEERRIKRDTAAKLKHEKEERRVNCMNARDRLRNLQDAGHIYGLDDKGERVVFSDAQRRRTTEKARENVAYWCG